MFDNWTEDQVVEELATLPSGILDKARELQQIKGREVLEGILGSLEDLETKVGIDNVVKSLEPRLGEWGYCLRYKGVAREDVRLAIQRRLEQSGQEPQRVRLNKDFRQEIVKEVGCLAEDIDATLAEFFVPYRDETYTGRSHDWTVSGGH
jgi:hypothetical protein